MTVSYTPLWDSTEPQDAPDDRMHVMGTASPTTDDSASTGADVGADVSPLELWIERSQWTREDLQMLLDAGKLALLVTILILELRES